MTAPGLTLDVPAELVERIAVRAAEILAERGAAGGGEDGWLRGAAKIAAYIDSTPSRVYALAERRPPEIPVHRDGSALVARRSELDAWIAAGGGSVAWSNAKRRPGESP
jgi:hypothetical protein